MHKDISMENRNHWLDYAKAIGIILVVYGHVARGLFQAGLFPNHDIYHYVDSLIYSFHMPLFFFLSGTLFYTSFLKRGAKELVWSKIDTIVYPYLLWSLLQGGIEVFMSSYTNGNTELRDVLALLWHPRAQFWFLYSLFLIFALVATAFAIFGQKALLPLCLISAVAYLWHTPLLENLQYRLIALNLVFFMFGIAFSQTRINRFTAGLAWLPWAAAFAVSQYLFHSVLDLTFSDRGPFGLAIALISIMFIASVSISAATRPNPMIMLIGASSMAIYVMHILIGSGARIFLQKIIGTDSLAAHLLLGCSLGIVLPMLVFAKREKLHLSYLFSAPIAKALKGGWRKKRMPADV